MKTALAASAIVALATTASAGTFFDTTQTANGDWDVAASALGPIIDIDIAVDAGPLTPNVPLNLPNGVSAVADGPDADSDSLGFGVTLGGTTSTFTFNFSTPILAWSLPVINGNVTNGLTVTTDLGTYDLEALNGGPITNPIGVVETGPITSISFAVTNPGGATDLFFVDAPLRIVEIPSPGPAAMAGLAGLAALRRRR